MDGAPAWQKSLLAQRNNVAESPDVLVINGKVYMQVGNAQDVGTSGVKQENQVTMNRSQAQNNLWQNYSSGPTLQVNEKNGYAIGGNHTSVSRSQSFVNVSKANNAFLSKNVKVREWTPRNHFDEEDEEVKQTFNMWSSKEDESKETPSNSNTVAQQDAIVDTLKMKLEMKKQEKNSQESNSEYGVVLKKNIFRQFDQTKGYKKDDTSTDGGSSEPSMVQVVAKATAGARINIGNYDQSREAYYTQFSEKTRPISEVSPIKTQLEGIYSKEKSMPSKSKATTEIDVVFTSKQDEEKEKARKAAAVQAMEKVIPKKEEDMALNGTQNEKVEPAPNAPIPAKRQSIKRNTSPVEYTQVSVNNTKQPAIKIVEFGNSGTDYKTIKKIIGGNN